MPGAIPYPPGPPDQSHPALPLHRPLQPGLAVPPHPVDPGSLRALGSLRTVRAGCSGCARRAFIRQQRPEGGTDRVGGLSDTRLDTDVAGAVILHGIVDGVVGAAVPCLAPYHTGWACGSLRSGRTVGSRRALRSRPTLLTLGALRAVGALGALRTVRTGRAGCARAAFIRQQRPEGGADRVGGLTDPRLDTDVAGAVILHGIVDGVVGAAVPCLAPYHTGWACGSLRSRCTVGSGRALRSYRTL